MNHNDRIVFGTASTFLFKYPGREGEISESKEGGATGEYDWEFAQRELLEKTEKIKKQQLELFEKEKEAESKKIFYCIA